jgi:hypothetical protein
MILYSVVPEEVVFDGIDDYKPNYIEIKHNGVTMQIEPMNSQQAKIVRLFSANVQDYMNPAYMPGTIVDYSVTFPKP